jgi:hypothetical protein
MIKGIPTILMDKHKNNHPNPGSGTEPDSLKKLSPIG